MKLTEDFFSKENLLDTLHLSEFTDSEKDTLFGLVMDILEIKFLDCVLSELTEDDKREFTRLLVDDTQQDAVKNFLHQHIADLDQKLEDVVADFKKELVVDILQAKADLLKGGRSV